MVVVVNLISIPIPPSAVLPHFILYWEEELVRLFLATTAIITKRFLKQITSLETQIYTKNVTVS